MSDQIMLLPSDAPEPLEIYETPRIHPDNQKLMEERLARFRPLEKQERKVLIKRLGKLHRELNRLKFNHLMTERAETLSAYQQSREEFESLQAKMKTAWDSQESLFDKRAAVAGDVLPYRRLKGKLKALIERGKRLNHAVADLAPLYQEYVEVKQRLDDHERMLKEQAEEEWQQKKFFREAKIIEGIVLSTFARTKGCHHVWQDSRGRHQVEVPKFQESGSNADSHWFLLRTTVKERFGWRDVLPYLVDIGELTSERVIENLSVAVGFQCEVRRSEDLTKILFRFNRLDSPDGLPKYFAFQTMFQFYPERDHDKLPFPLGVFDNRRVKWSNLADDPHILIAGKTQHGKSNYLNNIIATWIQFHSPQELRLILCDMKGGVEFTAWKNIPHLLGDFVKFEKDLMPRLREARKIISDRLALLEKAGKTDIGSYNRDVVDQDKRLPHIVIVIDEMQTLLGRSKWTRAVHHHLSVIASQGRAPGVHLILCTQHPSKEVIPMPIKANMSLLVMFLMSAHSALTLMADTAPSRLPPRVIGRVVFASGLEQDEAQTALILPDDKASAARFAIKTYAPSPWYVESGSPTLAPAAETETAPDARPALPAHTDAPIPAKPGTLFNPRFTEDDMIAIALDNFEGRFTAEGIYKIAKQQRLATQGTVRALAKVILERGTAEHDGTQYKLVNVGGRTVQLVPLNRETVEPSETEIDEASAGQLDSLTVQNAEEMEAIAV